MGCIPTQVLQADKVLQSIGFAPNMTGYGLENTGVKVTERGAIDVDERCRTSVPHIYAIGDVTAKLMLAHAAEAMGVVAAETPSRAETMELDYVMIPRTIFCQAQIASFGYTEEQAREQGFDVQVAQFPFTAIARAHGLGDATGFVKLISDAKYGEFIGAHLFGPDVTELLPELTLAQQWDLTVHEVARNVHAHPTLGEAVEEAVHGLAGHMINMQQGAAPSKRTGRCRRARCHTRCGGAAPRPCSGRLAPDVQGATAVSSTSRSTVRNVTGCSATTEVLDSGVSSPDHGAPPLSTRKNSVQPVLSRHPSRAVFPIGSCGVALKAKYALRVGFGEVVVDLAVLRQHVQRHDRCAAPEDAEADAGESGQDSATLSPGWTPRETSRFATGLAAASRASYVMGSSPKTIAVRSG